jgi:hypothetical protein
MTRRGQLTSDSSSTQQYAVAGKPGSSPSLRTPQEAATRRVSPRTNGERLELSTSLPLHLTFSSMISHSKRRAASHASSTILTVSVEKILP